MPYAQLTIVAIIALLAFLKERNFFNPVLIFSSIWVLAMFTAGLALYRLKPTSEYAYGLACLGVCLFAGGALLRDFFGRKRFSPPPVAPNYKLLLLYFTPVVLFAIFLAAKSILLLRHGVTMDIIRANYNNAESGLLIANNTVFVFQNFFVDAGVFASVGLIPVIAAEPAAMPRNIVLLELLLLQVCFIFISGARAFMAMAVLSFILYALLNRQFSRQFANYVRKIPKGLAIVLTVLFLAVAWRVTTMRKDDGRTFFYEAYRYISLSMPLFDTRLQMLDDTHVYTHGWTLLHGFVKTPLFFWRKIAGVPWPQGLVEASKQVAANNDFYYVGGGYGGRGGYVNSFVTVFYYMMMDWGIVGLVVESIVYGWISQACYRRVRFARTPRAVAVYLLLAIGLVFSFVRLHFTAHRYVDAFIIIWFSFSRAHPPHGTASQQIPPPSGSNP